MSVSDHLSDAVAHGLRIAGVWLSPDDLKAVAEAVETRLRSHDVLLVDARYLHGLEHTAESQGAPRRRNPHCSNCGDTRGGPFGHEISECTYRRPSGATPLQRLGRIAGAHDEEVLEGGLTSGECVECGHAWPCPSFVWATTARDLNATWDPRDDEPADQPREAS